MIRSRQGGKRVGELKIEVVHRMIESYGVNLLSKHVGGDAGRTLYFYSDTGEIYLKRHKSSRVVPEEQGLKIDKLPGFLPVVRS